MNRGVFSAVTIALSAAVFAGVWTATGAAIEPAPLAPVADIPPLPPIAEASHAAREANRAVATMRSRPARHRRRPVIHARAASVAAPRREAVAEVWYPGCHAVRAAGAAPLYRGRPGYRIGMDGDNDGIACEPYRGG